MLLTAQFLQTFRGSITCRESCEKHFTVPFIEHSQVTNLLILPPEFMVLLKDTFLSGVQNALQRYLKYNATINFEILFAETTLPYITRSPTPVPENDAPFQRYLSTTFDHLVEKEKLTQLTYQQRAALQVHCPLGESFRRLQTNLFIYYCSYKPTRQFKNIF